MRAFFSKIFTRYIIPGPWRHAIPYYSALPISRGHFSPNYSQKTPIGRPLGRGIASFVSYKCDQSFAFEVFVMRAISCYTALRYIESSLLDHITVASDCDCAGVLPLTHWCQVTHICVSKLIIIGADNGLSPGRRQTIILTDAGISLIGPLARNFSEILIDIYTFSFTKMHLKMLYLGLNVLKQHHS